MTTFKRVLDRSWAMAAVLAFGALLVVPSIAPNGKVGALQLNSRYLNMASNSVNTVTTTANGSTAAAGTYYNGSQTKHTLNFTLPSTTAVRGILVQYCDSPLPQTACSAPVGLSTSGFTGSVTSTGFVGSNTWTVDTATVAGAGGPDYFATGACSTTTPFRQNCILLTSADTTAETTTAVSIPLGSAGNGWITNPTNAQNFYVRIQTFSGTAFTNAQALDNGAVAGSTTTGIDVTSAVQETLNFSVAANWVTPSTNCAPVTGSGAVGLGNGTNFVLDTTTPYYANSWYRLNTNASNGTLVQYSGDTLKTTGGTNTIAAVGATKAAVTLGQEKFGFMVDTTATNATATPQAAITTNYVTANQFAYDTTSTTTPVTIASAPTGTTVTCDSEAIRYVGSAATTTKAGLYKTSISYFAIPTF